MIKFARAVIVALASVAVAVTMTISGQTTAHATASDWHRITVSGTEWNALKPARDAVMVKGTHTLAWSTLHAKYKGTLHPDNWPDQIAAGWLHGGNSITGMPSADRARAIKILDQTWGIGPHVAQPMVPNCRGVNKTVQSSGKTSYYFNSCVTTDIIYGTVACLPLAGLLLGQVPGWGSKVTGAVMVVGCSISGAAASAAKANSSVGGMIVQEEDMGWNPTPPGNEYVVTRVLPQ